jgi:hypothetical protein
MRKIFLTFDIEDFISDNSIQILHEILTRLNNHELEAMFFLTGHMAEKLQAFPKTVDMLAEHQIGYHSSSHSVHPTIFEFTDIPSYEEAYKVSLERETRHINPLTGDLGGKGGILALRRLFKKKQICAYRAPGHCWVPPHLEALRTLGVNFDFSANISRETLDYKGLTFYPHEVIGQWEGRLFEYWVTVLSFLRNELTIISLHPSLLANLREWDVIYQTSNPPILTPPPMRNPREVRKLLRNLDLLFKQISTIQKKHLVDTTFNLKSPEKALDVKQLDIVRCYQNSMKWAFKKNYRTKFLFKHFLKFFDANIASLPRGRMVYSNPSQAVKNLIPLSVERRRKADYEPC